jgi:hypothetical protein
VLQTLRKFFIFFSHPKLNIFFAFSDPATLYKTCSFSKGESCIKVTIYDKYDKTRPIAISRSCGYVPIQGTAERISNRCTRVFNGVKDIEVCACNDKNKCNSGTGNKTNFVLITFIIAVFRFLCWSNFMSFKFNK